MFDPQRRNRSDTRSTETQEGHQSFVAQLSGRCIRHHGKRTLCLFDAGRWTFRGSAGFGLIAQREAEIFGVFEFDASANAVLLRKPDREVAEHRHDRALRRLGQRLVVRGLRLFKMRAKVHRPVDVELGKFLAPVPDIEAFQRGDFPVQCLF
ncbi:hypothetical protein [uncultured Tateyamaria sp.]|uniref:hypothetical protein n=1 Tax=uncultured Tateyamaria sp. TaxID=455651 RepID=UPI0026328B89|nr:hypothetical protein [uncultured Tateyamaria sp.]